MKKGLATIKDIKFNLKFWHETSGLLNKNVCPAKRI